jgi:NitT/TauT family transport system substrate-binding protein
MFVISRRALILVAAIGLGAQAATPSARADGTLKVAVGQRGSWDTSVSELGQKAGIFKKHGLDLDLLFTQGAGETQQATISGSVDIGIGGGVMGVLGAFEKGAPIRVIGTEINSAGDYWYVPTASPIKTIKDANGATMAFSTNGSSTQAIVLAIIKEHGLTNAKPVATGGPPATFTQVMSGQIDVGWATPPFGIQALEEGKIRILARGNDIKEIREQTNRLLITNASLLERRKGDLLCYMTAYRETVGYMYSNPMALKYYAEIASVPESLARRVRDEFFTKDMLMPDKVIGLDIIMPAAVSLKYLAAPIPDDKLKTLFQVPYQIPNAGCH